MEPHFVHPLSSLETIDTDEGKKEVINSWAFASVIWSTALDGNENALILINEVFPDKSRIPLLILRSKQGDETAMRDAIGIIAFAIDDKLTEAFEPKGN
ncbi:hypothetical protein [Microcoleus asticus]|uniref:Uncharacterized protein n=1 Tax=Microcoleus asticus IPMA8 TaxID=2563858 RepID=A0ABX2D2A6_9CYAN|nr:hypothetical protein [Microcoleus asticus]NQE36739.1 hypothetical protein [Microcoleus asticus IPMA8]